ncbi:AraC family ligand binding domain-containing protein [Cohnella ginsengisoli]|uniref:AraC family ligand binding domain-containing protein n=1 Tax=Cohnella ginsengisoli TaxID=425004 RepID=A0A9X4QMM1_9BACL|nr:AraC family ligand binding domain-containing protein [Cohnella ginsengisoli]MDG0791511.1 AraC family ligand binding domain-containing protein [Cohnella ginsengisoli]
MNNQLSRKRLLQMYLSNLQVNVTALGFNPVWSDWRGIDYTPDYNKFYFITDGEGWLKIGDRELYPKPGQLALMPEGVRQSYSAINDKPYTKFWCHFTAKIGTINLFDLIRLPLDDRRAGG